MIRGVRIRILFPFFHFPKHRVLQTIVFFTKGNKALFSLLPFPETSSRSEKARLFFERKGVVLLWFGDIRTFFPILHFPQHRIGKHVQTCSSNTCFFFTMIRGNQDLISLLSFPETSSTSNNRWRENTAISFPFFHVRKHPADQKKCVYFFPRKGEKDLTSFLSVPETSSRHPNLHVVLYC